MPENSTDHDILIALRSEVRLGFANMKEEIKDVKTNTSAIAGDHESRIRTIEASRWKIIGGAAAASAIVSLLGVLAAYLALR